MSKDKYRMPHKRIEKKLAAKCGVQVREVHEVIMKDVVNPLKRRQEAWQTAKYRYEPFFTASGVGALGS